MAVRKYFSDLNSNPWNLEQDGSGRFFLNPHEFFFDFLKGVVQDAEFKNVEAEQTVLHVHVLVNAEFALRVNE